MTREECAKAHHEQARVHEQVTGCNLFTECDAGHEQLSCAECDGVHCYRACDEVARAECRARVFTEAVYRADAEGR